MKQISIKPLAVFATAAILLSACAASDQRQSGSGAESGLGTAQVAEAESQANPALSADNPGSNDMQETAAALARAEAERSQPTLYKGTDQLVNIPRKRPPVKLLGEDVTLNFEQAPLIEVVHAVMGDVLELDYIVEHPIKGEITLRTRTPVPRDQLLGILESLLQSNKALMVRDKNGRYIISASGQMGKLQPGVSNSTNKGAGYSTVVVPLKYIGAKNMAEILKPVADEAAFVRVDSARNLLMLAGTRAQLDGWAELIYTFDVDMLKGMSVGIFPLENSTVEDIDMALAGLLGRSPGGQAEGDSNQGIGGLVRIIPVERLNSILVVTPRAHYLERLRTWIERLDRTPESSFEQRLFVYPVQNGNANHIAELLSNIFSGGSKSGSSRSSGGVAPGLTPETVSSSGTESSPRSTSRSPSGGATNFSVGSVRVIADDENNALLIYATGKEFKKIEAALLRLDVVPAQVIIEASILEVTLTDELKYGLEWTFKGDLGDSYSGVGQLINQGNSIAQVVPGFSYTVSNSIGDISAVLNALAEDSLVNVISTPSVMVLDNHTAFIHVGDQIPVQSGTAITDGGTSIEKIEYRDTGVKLSVTPSVNAGGMVTMDIEQSVTDVGTVDPATRQRSFLERNFNSRVAVRSNESVVLGGLIRENSSQGASGIPWLYKIPVVGSLFGTTENTSRRTELLVIITPRVMFDEEDLREVSREMRSRMRDFELIDQSSSAQLLIDGGSGLR